MHIGRPFQSDLRPDDVDNDVLGMLLELGVPLVKDAGGNDDETRLPRTQKSMVSALGHNTTVLNPLPATLLSPPRNPPREVCGVHD